MKQEFSKSIDQLRFSMFFVAALLMVIGKINNLFSNSSYTVAQKSDGKSGFASALQWQLKSAEAQRAEDMTEAIEALDRALEKAEAERQILSKGQADWLGNRYSIGDMVIQRNVERTVQPDGSIVEFSGGSFFSEAHNNLLDDLHALGLLSDRDMRILSRAHLNMIPVELVTPDDRWAMYDNDGNRSGWLMPADAGLDWQALFDEANRSSDIIGYHRAMAETELLIFEMLEGRKNPYFGNISSYNWYRELAETRNRLADILEQIF
jgi:hypothetical protein